MVVVGIMAILMTMTVPLVYKVKNREPMNKAVRDMMEVCSQARAQAILKGTMTVLVFYPKEKRCQVSTHSGEAPTAETESSRDAGSSEPPRNSGLAARLHDSITIEMLDINLIEYKDADVARVRFYPNATCDEMTLVLRSDQGVWMKLWLEITTGFADVGPLVR
jgi:Tfp pilus assembly major pilin PilA